MKIHEYNEMMAYLTRPRRNFLEGGDIIIPKKKPSEEAEKIKWIRVLEALKKLGEGPSDRRDWINTVSEHLDDGLRKGIINKAQFNNFIKQ